MPDPKPLILFVDDEPDVLSGLQRSLHKKKTVWELRFVRSADRALKSFAEKPCDVIVTDLMMPGMNGIELVQQMNTQAPQLPCIMLSGTADLQDAAQLINTTRVFRFYSKPCEPAALIEGIEAALHENSSVQQAPSVERLSEAFALTRSEARLTQALVLGNSLEAAALQIGVTPSSARTYLKRVFDKTETSRQAELVSKVLLHLHRGLEN